MHKPQADALLADFGASLGLADLSFDDEGTCALGIEGGGLVEIIIDEATATLVLSAAVGTPLRRTTR